VLIVWSANHTVPFLLWNLKVHYHINRSLPLALILCQLNAICTLQPCVPRKYFIIISPCVPSLPSGSLCFRLHNQHFVRISYPIDTCCMPSQSHSWFYNFNNFWRVQSMEFIMQFSPASCHLIVLWPKYLKHPVLRCPQSVKVVVSWVVAPYTRILTDLSGDRHTRRLPSSYLSL
jgi:hypothetical protein